MLDDNSFFFLVDVLEKEVELIDNGASARVARQLWIRSPSTFIRHLNSQTSLSQVTADAFTQFGIDDILDGLRREPGVLFEIAMRRPDIGSSSRFWEVAGVEGTGLLGNFAASSGASAVIRAILRSGQTALAPSILREFGANSVIGVLLTMGPETIEPWLSAVRPGPDQYARVLTAPALSKRTLLQIANAIPADSVPGVDAEDPWFVAWTRSTSDLTVAEDAYMAAYFIDRGLGFRSPTPATLLQQSFERGHQYLAASVMPAEGWGLIESHLPWVTPWSEWDRCSRLRTALVNRFVDDGLNPWIFGRITHSDALWDQLVDLAAKSGRGRRYLEQVRRSLAGESGPALQRRAKVIGSLIK